MPNRPANKPSENFTLAVQVARIDDLAEQLDGGNLSWLTEGELARYEGMNSSPRKRQFLAGHYLVRKTAANLFNNSPENWAYFQDEEALRRLKSDDGISPALYISITHAGQWIAAAISGEQVGLDIETYEKERDFIAIANHVFSVDEVRDLSFCGAGELKRRFYLYWTLKEAIGKRHGHGLKFEISRKQSPRTVAESELANIYSWECPDYVLSLSSDASCGITTLGLSANVIHKTWRNAI